MNLGAMNFIKKTGKRIVKTFLALPILLKVILVIGSIGVITVLADLAAELVTGVNNPKNIYDTLDVEEMKDLVEIKESEDGSGYYLDFKEDYDEKVKKIVQNAKNRNGLHNLPQKEAEEFIKKLIKAEVVTQFPNLGGNIPEDSNGFQGSVDIRRITPNKEIGSIDDNPGRGEEIKTDQDDEIHDVNDSPNDEETVKTWQQGQALTIKGRATIWEQTASQLTPGSDTGHWYRKPKKNEINVYETIADGTEVTYTGTYKKSTNAITKETVIYVQIQHEEEKVFVRSTNLRQKADESEGTEEEGNENIENGEDNESGNDEELGEDDIDGTAKKEEQTTPKIKALKTAGEEGKQYRIAIAARHNNTDNTGARSGSLREEELTIKTAEKVEELLKEYSNITVIQTGSTSSNRGGVKVRDRTKLARKARPDLCIQIHYDAGGGSGVQAIYKKGDNVSAQLAKILAASMSESMGLKNKGAGPDAERCAIKNLGIIESAAKSGFPSVVTEGRIS